MTCSVCGSNKVRKVVRDQPYVYKSVSTTIPKVTSHRCSDCKETMLDWEEAERVSALQLAHNQWVNQQQVKPQYIVQVRKKLEMSQKQASDIFGGGINAFTRYESGRATPSIATVKLLKLLDKHPELLDEVAAL